METIFVLSVNGNEYRLTLPSKWIIEAEKRLGESMLAALEHIDRLSVVTVVLWAALQKFGHGMTLDKAASSSTACVTVAVNSAAKRTRTSHWKSARSSTRSCW